VKFYSGYVYYKGIDAHTDADIRTRAKKVLGVLVEEGSSFDPGTHQRDIAFKVPDNLRKPFKTAMKGYRIQFFRKSEK